MNEEKTGWHPLMPADGPVEFPTMGNYTLRIRTRHDGNYMCDVIWGNDTVTASWLLTPDIHVAICILKTDAQADADEQKFLKEFSAIAGE